jgi:hypothetical protein
VVVLDPGQACNVSWWVNGGATLTTSNFVGTILVGAAITVTGGKFNGHALATAAATLTNPALLRFSRLCSHLQSRNVVCKTEQTSFDEAATLRVLATSSTLCFWWSRRKR